MTDDSDDDQIAYFTREEAEALAKSEVLREYSDRGDSISYIAYLSEFHDYCFCELVEEDGRWVKTFRALLPEERLQGEEILDETIVRLARTGNMVSAVRLFRSRHGVGLKEAFAAVQALLSVSPVGKLH